MFQSLDVFRVLRNFAHARNARDACWRAHVLRMGMRSRVQARACVGARVRARQSQ